MIGAALIILPENLLRWSGWFLLGWVAGKVLMKSCVRKSSSRKNTERRWVVEQNFWLDSGQDQAFTPARWARSCKVSFLPSRHEINSQHTKAGRDEGDQSWQIFS